MSIKKITDLDEATDMENEDVIAIVDVANSKTKKIQASNLWTALIPKNSGAHNSFYRGEDITDLFYNGTLSEQIAAETFDNIFIGDYIKGQTSGLKYLVADINYRLHTGSTETSTPHVLMIPELNMGTAQMNSSNITTGAYISSEMYTTNLEPYREIIRTDFAIDGTSHILTHQEHFQNAVTNGYASGGTWYDSDIDLMNEPMIYGSYIYAPATHNQGGTDTVRPNLYTIDKSQLALFRFMPELIRPYASDGTTRQAFWLRDVVSSSHFATVISSGVATYYSASNSYGVRPAFLIV